MDLPQVTGWLDQEDARTAAMVREHGWYIEYVIGDDRSHETSIAYTIGLFGLGHPELVVLGVPPATAAGLMNEVGRRIKAGANLVPGEVLSFDDWPHKVTVEEIPNPGEILFGANRFYARPDAASVPAYQLTYDDLDGRFPWDDGYSTPAWIQPRPGEYRA